MNSLKVKVEGVEGVEKPKRSRSRKRDEVEKKSLIFIYFFLKFGVFSTNN